MKNLVKKMTLIFAAVALAVLTAGEAGAYLTAKANHDHITIDFFYDGSEVSVRGYCDKDVDLAVKITSPEVEQSLKKKGKTAGVLWMNVGSLKCEKTPNLYFLQCTKTPDSALSKEEMEKYVIGYSALQKHAELSPCSCQDDKSKWFSEFLKLKESNKLFCANTGGFSFGEKDGVRTYYMKFKWPYQAPPGDYLVTVYALKGGKVVDTANSKVLVEQVGAVKALHNLAVNNGAIFGFLSIISAIGAGFGVGLIFGKGGGAH